MIHAICVAGARPNLIKIKPVIDGLESLGARTTFVHTGQHYDEAMSGVFLNDLGLRQPDLSLGVGSGTHAEQTARVMVRPRRSSANKASPENKLVGPTLNLAGESISEPATRPPWPATNFPVFAGPTPQTPQRGAAR